MDDTFRNNNITIVKENDFINVMLNFIYNNNHNVTNYDEIKEIYVKMVGNGFFFFNKFRINNTIITPINIFFK